MSNGYKSRDKSEILKLIGVTLHEIFEEISFSDSELTKSQKVESIKDKYRADKFIMVGDRISDIEAARENEGISVGVTYGFCKDEPLKGDYVAEDFKEVENLIEMIVNEEKLVCFSS